MPSSFEVTGLSLGAISALSDVTKVFFSGRAAWKDAGDFERTASLFLLRYSVEEARLKHWCERAGFELQESDEGDKSFVAAALSPGLIRQRFARPYAQEMVAGALTEIKIHLQDIEASITVIKGPQPSQGQEDIEMADFTPRPNLTLPANERIAQIHRQRYEEHVSRTTRAPSADLRTKSLRIASAVGNSVKSLERALKELQRLNDQLECFLNEEQSDAVNEVLASIMLAGVTDHNHLASLVDMPSPGLPYLVIMAEDRYWSLEVERNLRGAATPISSVNFRDTVQFGLDSVVQGGRRRCLSRCDGKPCLIEWNRPADVQTEDDVQRIQEMVGRLVQMLCLEHPANYRVLRSQRMVLEDNSEVTAAGGKRWFGVAFQFPSFADASRAPVSLEELMSESDVPPLGEVFELARQLARCLLTFHTCGWLHQSLRSRNIVFFTDKDNPDQGPAIRRPYIIGFEYSRGSTDRSEGRDPAAIQSLREDMYQHPMRRCHHPRNNIVPYRREFDIYSLGRIFCDLACWEPLESNIGILDVDATPLALEEHVAMYPGNVGEIYTSVVRWCLGQVDGRIRTPNVPRNGSDDQQLTYEYHDKVLRQLIKCQA